MSDSKDADWVAVLKAAGVDVSFVEQEIRTLQRAQRIRSEEEPLRECLCIPDDIRAFTGDEIELWHLYRGQGRVNLRRQAFFIDHGKTSFLRGSLRIPSLPNRDARGALPVLARDDDELRCSPSVLLSPEPGILPLDDNGVCRRCSSRVNMGSLVSESDTIYSQAELWDLVRTPIDRPFERFVDPEEAPEHHCESEYMMWLTRQRKRRRERLRFAAERMGAELGNEEGEDALPNPRHRFVYLMKNSRNGHYKIGLSVHPEFRERTLQSQEPEVHLVWKIEGEKSDERHLHEKFGDRRLRGEWFDLQQKHVGWITSCGSSEEFYRE